MRLRGLLFVLVGLVVLGLPAGAAAAGGCSNEGLREAQGSTFLPECRAYEMVSPVDKNGGDILGVPIRTRSAANGDGVIFTSFAAFANAQGTNIAVEYAAERGAEGWSTNAITPDQQPTGFFFPAGGAQTRLEGDVSADLSTGVMLSAYRSLTSGAPNVAKAINFYLRRDLTSAPGSYELLTNSVSPVPLFFDVGGVNLYYDGASADFHHVFFGTSNNLTADASGEGYKLYESENGLVRLVGVAPDGTPFAEAWIGRRVYGGDLKYGNHMVSRDGSRVFFTDQATGNIYVRTDHTTTTKLNVSEGPTSSELGAELWDATPDGAQVFFTTAAELTEDDTNINSDLYRYDFNAPSGHHLTRLTLPQEGYDGEGGVREVLGVSGDGSYVYFVTSALRGAHAEIYVWHNGLIRHVGGLEQFAQQDIEGANYITKVARYGSWVRVTPSGTLVYTSSTPQTSYDTEDVSNEDCIRGHCEEVYVYRPAAGEVMCASCNPSGAAPNGDASFTKILDKGRAGQVQDDPHLTHPVSDDGSKVFFESPEALVPADTNGRYDVYEFDVPAHELHLISSGQAKADAVFLDASPDGSNVFFSTRQQLVGEDVDGNADLYDARIGGGIAAQSQIPVVGCSGDGCQGPLIGAPAISAPASSTLTGAGNLPAPAVGAEKPKAKKKPKAHKHKVRRHKKQAKTRRARRSGKSASRRAGR